MDNQTQYLQTRILNAYGCLIAGSSVPYLRNNAPSTTVLVINDSHVFDHIKETPGIRLLSKEQAIEWLTDDTGGVQYELH